MIGRIVRPQPSNASRLATMVILVASLSLVLSACSPTQPHSTQDAKTLTVTEQDLQGAWAEWLLENGEIGGESRPAPGWLREAIIDDYNPKYDTSTSINDSVRYFGDKKKRWRSAHFERLELDDNLTSFEERLVFYEVPNRTIENIVWVFHSNEDAAEHYQKWITPLRGVSWSSHLQRSGLELMGSDLYPEYLHEVEPWASLSADIDSQHLPVALPGLGDEAKFWWNIFQQPVILFRSGNVVVWLGAIPNVRAFETENRTQKTVSDSYIQLVALASVLESRIALQ